MAQYSRYSTAQPTPGRHSMAPTQSRTTLFGELPPYRKPSHPLNEKALDKLKTIYDKRTLHLLQGQHQTAQQQITDAARGINDQLREAEERVERRRRKWKKGINLDEQEETEQNLEDLKEKTAELTRKLEIDMRSVIDSGMAAQRIDETLDWLRETAPRQLADEYRTQISQRQSQSQSQSQRRRRQRDADGDDDMEEDEEEYPSPGPTPLDGSRVALTGPTEMFKNRQTKERDDYTSISHSARYAQNNAYIGFKKMVYDARYGDDGPAMPRPNTWFTDSGSPAPGVTAAQNGEDSDDDIVVDKATVSIKCPITLQKFKDPMSSNKCPHTFEKSAILDMIRGSAYKPKSIECPVPGCSKILTAADLAPDEILIRKIKRMQALEARRDEDSDDEVAAPRIDKSQVIGSDDEEAAVSASSPRWHKREEMSSAPIARASSIVDLGDPSDEDDDDDDDE